MSQTRKQAREKILKLAKQGDPVTLAALLERKLRDRAISVRVEREGDSLSIALESEQSLERAGLVEAISRAMKKLETESLKTVEIRGYQRGQQKPDWVETLGLDASSGMQTFSAWLESNLVFPSAAKGAPMFGTKPPGEEFLRFQLTPRDAALLPVSCIKEVLQVSANEILPVPHTSELLLGVYNWRGEMLWLVDLNRLLGFDSQEPSARFWNQGNRSQGDKASAIALCVDNQILGLLVRQINDLERHDLQELEAPTAGLFAPQVLPFVRGYLTESNAIILDARAILFGAKQLGQRY